jgi:hypothetical protein
MHSKFDALIEVNPDAMLADGFEEAYRGYVDRWEADGSRGAVAVYSRNECIDILITRDEMSWEDAEDHFCFNVEGAYVGPFTPLFLVEPEDDVVE